MSLPMEKNITLYQGDTFEMIFRLLTTSSEYVDLTGCTVDSQIRATKASGTVVETFLGEITDQDELPGGVRLSLTAAETTLLTADGVWDVQLTWPDGTVKTYLGGSVTVVKEVTRV